MSNNNSKLKQFFIVLWEKILNPVVSWKLFLFYLFSLLIISATLVLVILGFTEEIFSYILYVFAFLSLCYTGYTIWFFASRVKKGVINFLNRFELTANILKNYGYRTFIFSTVTSIINILYTAFLLVLAILGNSAWYYSLATYYLLLSLIRTGVIISQKKNKSDDEKAVYLKSLTVYRNCGIIFMIITFALSGIILLTVKNGMTFEYAGLLIYAVAAYTFYKLTLSIFNLVKSTKQDNAYIKSLRNVNMADSMVSLLSLQMALLTAFAGENVSFVFNALTGAVVCALIIALGIQMIIYAKLKKKSFKENFNGQ